MDKAQCVALFLVVLALFARPSLGTLKERTSEITAWHCFLPRNLRVSVGFRGWQDNMAQEAPGGWAINLVAEFPAS